MTAQLSHDIFFFRFCCGTSIRIAPLSVPPPLAIYVQLSTLHSELHMGEKKVLHW
jgi:hypothetical protein